MNRSRPRQFSFHANDEEASKIRRNAQKARTSLQRFLLANAKKETFTLEDMEGFTLPIIVGIHRVGGLLNQIAKAKNSAKTWSTTDLARNLDELETLIAEVRRTMVLSKEDMT